MKIAVYNTMARGQCCKRQNYRVTLAIWDHTVLPATRHKQTHPALTPASEGWYSIYLPRRDGRLS